MRSWAVIVDQVTDTTETNNISATRPSRDSRLVFRAAAWVGIVAGAVFILGGIFTTGFVLGHHGGGGGHRQHAAPGTPGEWDVNGRYTPKVG